MNLNQINLTKYLLIGAWIKYIYFKCQKKKLQDYEIGNLDDLDFLKVFKALENIKKSTKFGSLQEYRKSYVNSLFSPLCSYAIDYLNENKEKTGVIGTSIVTGKSVIYIILNQTVFWFIF